jgi:hypothetical protein
VNWSRLKADAPLLLIETPQQISDAAVFGDADELIFDGRWRHSRHSYPP